MAAQVSKLHLTKPQRHVWRKSNAAYQHNNLTSTVGHGGGRGNAFSSFCSPGTGHLALTESTVHFLVYKSILEANVRLSV